mmetsp:Transcript_21922/g.58448  ORF Transcript_21922/g.58448 Transcript_21922/m.58448 type:complete len:217 (+) Transcript_21922:134-784(+)
MDLPCPVRLQQPDIHAIRHPQLFPRHRHAHRPPHPRVPPALAPLRPLQHLAQLRVRLPVLCAREQRLLHPRVRHAVRLRVLPVAVEHEPARARDDRGGSDLHAAGGDEVDVDGGRGGGGGGGEGGADSFAAVVEADFDGECEAVEGEDAARVVRGLFELALGFVDVRIRDGSFGVGALVVAHHKVLVRHETLVHGEPGRILRRSLFVYEAPILHYE